MVAHPINSYEEYERTIKSYETVILKAYLESSKQCRHFMHNFKELSEQDIEAHFAMFDVKEIPQLAQELNNRKTPTFYIFRSGEKVGETSTEDQGELISYIREVMLKT